MIEYWNIGIVEYWNIEYLNIATAEMIELNDENVLFDRLTWMEKLSRT